MQIVAARIQLASLPPPIAPLDRLKSLLEGWAEWTRGYRPRLGHSARAVSLVGAGPDWDQVFSGEENRISRVIDTAIDDLPTNQSCAIHHRYLCSVYRMRDYAQTLDTAHERLLIVLPRKNIIL